MPWRKKHRPIEVVSTSYSEQENGPQNSRSHENRPEDEQQDLRKERLRKKLNYLFGEPSFQVTSSPSSLSSSTSHSTTLEKEATNDIVSTKAKRKSRKYYRHKDIEYIKLGRVKSKITPEKFKALQNIYGRQALNWSTSNTKKVAKQKTTLEFRSTVMDPLIVNVNNNSRNETSDASELPDCSSVDVNVEQLAENIQHLSKNSDCKQSKTSNIIAESKMNLNHNRYIVHNNTCSSLNQSTTMTTSTTSKLNGRLESETLSTDLTYSNENDSAYRNVTVTIRNGITDTLRQHISESSRKASSVSHTKKIIDSNSHKRKSDLVLDDHAIKTYRDHYSNKVPSIQYPISLVDWQRLFLLGQFGKPQLPLLRIQEIFVFFWQIQEFSEPLSLSESRRRLPLFLPEELALLLSQILSPILPIYDLISQGVPLTHHPLQDTQLRQQQLRQILNNQEQQQQARQQLQVRHPQQQHLKQELRKPQLHERLTQQHIQPTLHEHQPQQRQIQKNLVEHELQERQAQSQFRQKLQKSQPQQQQLQQKIQECPPRQQYTQQQLGNYQLQEHQDQPQLRQEWEKHQTPQYLRQLAERQVQQHIQPLFAEYQLKERQAQPLLRQELEKHQLQERQAQLELQQHLQDFQPQHQHLRQELAKHNLQEHQPHIKYQEQQQLRQKFGECQQQFHVYQPQQLQLQELEKHQVHERQEQQQLRQVLEKHQLQERRAQPQLPLEVEKYYLQDLQAYQQTRPQLQERQLWQPQIEPKLGERLPWQQLFQPSLGEHELGEQPLREHQTRQQLLQYQTQQHELQEYHARWQQFWATQQQLKHNLLQQPQFREHQTQQQQFVENPLQQQQIIQYHTPQQPFLEYYTQQHTYQERQAQEQQFRDFQRHLETETNRLQQYRLQYKCYDQLLIEQQKQTQPFWQQELREGIQKQSHQQLQPQHLQTTLMIEQDALTHSYATIERSEVCIREQSAPLNLVKHRSRNVRTSIQSKTVKRRSIPFETAASKILRMNSESTVRDSTMPPVSSQVTIPATDTTSTTTAPSMASLSICPLITKTTCETRTSHQRKLAKPIKIRLPKQAETFEQPSHSNFSISNMTNNSVLSQEQFVEAFRSSMPQLSIIPIPTTEFRPREVPALPEVTITSLHPKDPSQSKPTSKCNEDSSQLSKSTNSSTKSRNYNVLLSESSRTDNLSKSLQINVISSKLLNINENIATLSEDNAVSYKPPTVNSNPLKPIKNIEQSKINDCVLVQFKDDKVSSVSSKPEEIASKLPIINGGVSQLLNDFNSLEHEEVYTDISSSIEITFEKSIDQEILFQKNISQEISDKSNANDVFSKSIENNNICSEKTKNNEIDSENTEDTKLFETINSHEMFSKTLENDEISSEKTNNNEIISKHFINNNFLTEVINNNEKFSKTSKNDNILTETNDKKIVSESLENIASAKMNDNVMVTEISKLDNLSEIITEIEILLETSMYDNISAASLQDNISSSNMDNNEVSTDDSNDNILSERLSNNDIFSIVLNNDKMSIKENDKKTSQSLQNNTVSFEKNSNNEIIFRNTKENTVSSKIIRTKEISSQSLMNEEVSSEKIGANVIISEIKNKEISYQTSKNEAISSGLSSSAVRNNISYENLNNNVIVSETPKDNNVSEKINNKEFSETSNNDESNSEASFKQKSFKSLQNNDICSETINENKIVAESAKQNDISSEISNNNGLLIKPNVNDNTVTLPENVEITSEPFNIYESVPKVQQNKKTISETLLSSEIITEKRLNINSSMDESFLEDKILKNDIPKKKDCEASEKRVKNANISPQLIDCGTEAVISNGCKRMKENIENPILANNLNSNGASENAAETRTGSNRNRTVSVCKRTNMTSLRRTTKHSRTSHVGYPLQGRQFRCMQTISLDLKYLLGNRFNQRRRDKQTRFWFGENRLVNFRKSKRPPLKKISTNISIVKEDSKDSQSTPEENRNAPDIIEIIDDDDNEEDQDVTLVSSTIYIDLCDDDSNQSDKDIFIQSHREVRKNSNRNNNVQSTNITERSTFSIRYSSASTVRTGTNMNEPKVPRPIQLINHHPNVYINCTSYNYNVPMTEYNRIVNFYNILRRNKGPTLNAEEYVDEVNLLKRIPNSNSYVNYYTFITRKQIANNSLPISFGVFLEFYRDGKLTMFDDEYNIYMAKHAMDKNSINVDN